MYEKTFSQMYLRRSLNNLETMYRLENSENKLIDLCLEEYAKDYKKVIYKNMLTDKDFADQLLKIENREYVLKEELKTIGVKSEEVLIIIDEIQAENRALDILKQFKEILSEYHVLTIGYNRDINCYLKEELIHGDVVYCEFYPIKFKEFLEKSDNHDKYPSVTFFKRGY